MLKKGLLLIAALFFTSAFSLAQVQDTVIVENEDGVKDTIILEDNDWGDNNWEDEWEENWDRDWDDFNWSNFIHDFKGRPTLSINYGFSKLDRYNFSSKFGEPVMAEGKLGYISEHSDFDEDYIAEYNYKFFRLSNVSTKLSQKDIAEDEIESSMWRFGFGKESGYGWKFGESAVTPYNSNSWDWSRVEVKERFAQFAINMGSNLDDVFPTTGILVESAESEQDLSPGEESNVIERYNKTFRFGTSTEAGIKFRLIAGITLDAAYERAIIFERHLFWKWAGSAIIEYASQGLLDEFISEVGYASPAAVPIVNFVLKNALSYAIYELRTEKMNWPFNSASPLHYDQFKFGLTFMF